MEATGARYYAHGTVKNHCKIMFATSNGTVDAIAWNRPDLFEIYLCGYCCESGVSLQRMNGKVWFLHNS